MLYDMEIYLQQQKLKSMRIDILKDILRKNEIPLHVTVLSRMAIDQNPNLFLNAEFLPIFIYGNSDNFHIENGVVTLPKQ
jgi:hypothetical protein